MTDGLEHSKVLARVNDQKRAAGPVGRVGDILCWPWKVGVCPSGRV